MLSLVEAQAHLNTARGIAMAGWTPRMSLWIGDPLAGGVEVSLGNGYARINVIFDVPSGNIMLNTNTVAFANPSGVWGQITHAALMDAMTGGNVRHSWLLAGDDEIRLMVPGAQAPIFGPGTIMLRAA